MLSSLVLGPSYNRRSMSKVTKRKEIANNTFSYLLHMYLLNIFNRIHCVNKEVMRPVIPKSDFHSLAVNGRCLDVNREPICAHNKSTFVPTTPFYLAHIGPIL